MSFYPRETVEFIPAHVYVDGVEVTTGVTLAVAADGTRPSTWVTPTTLNGDIGVIISGLTPGMYKVWAKVASSPETPVIELTPSFTVT